MANNPLMPAATATAMLDALAALANGGFIELFTGVQPATGGAAITTQIELVSFALGATAFGAPSGGVMAANAITPGVAINTGTATWFRLFASDGVTAILDGSVGTAGCDLNLASASINTGDIVGCTSFTLTLPLT